MSTIITHARAYATVSGAHVTFGQTSPWRSISSWRVAGFV